MYSLVIPVYKNEANLDRLLKEMVDLAIRIPTDFEVVFVVDGSPDRSLERLREALPGLPLQTQLISLSRNFGSFCAIAAGLERARGDYFAVIAADLQEPPELVDQFYEILAINRADLVFGVRSRRSDPWLSAIASSTFWWVYRHFVVREMPPGGVDVFGCNRQVRDRLLQFQEIDTNLIALLFWLGFRREYILYTRRNRLEGRSAWTIRKKIRYCLNSIFNFTDLPILVLIYSGLIALTVTIVWGTAVLIAKLKGDIPVPGYVPIVLAIMFFGALTSIGLGIIGQYLWLTLQNARRRPNYIVESAHSFEGRLDKAAE
jgi:glycosyltransferase involved in cell wall biosynthesis